MKITGREGVSLIEVMVGLVLLAAVCISSFGYFAYGLGAIGNQGNRRAALERARERLEQLLAANPGDLPPFNGTRYWCSAGSPCTTWTNSVTPFAQTVSVNDIPSRRIETSAQAVDDPSAGTTTLDAWEFSVKVWFSSDLNDDDLHRVYLRTLRTP